MNLPDAAYKALLMYAARAVAMGLALVHGAFEEYRDVDGSPSCGDRTRDILTGVCVMGAYNWTAQDDEVLPLPSDDAGEAAWDAIEHGWDTGSDKMALNGDTDELHPAEWVAVGVRLRAELNPRPARLP